MAAWCCLVSRDKSVAWCHWEPLIFLKLQLYSFLKCPSSQNQGNTQCPTTMRRSSPLRAASIWTSNWCCIVVVVGFGLSLLTMLLIYIPFYNSTQSQDTTVIMSRSYTMCTLFYVILCRFFDSERERFPRHSQTRPSRHCKFWQSLREIVKKLRFGMKHVMDT